MKKFYYLLLLLPLSLLMSCKDDEIDPVDMTLSLEGVTYTDNGFYTITGEEVIVESFSVKSVDNKNTALDNVMFSLNGVPIIKEPGNEYVIGFSTENLPAGKYSLNVTGNLLQVDSSIKIFAINYPITIVESSDDLPSGAPEIGTYSQTIRVNK